MPKNKTRSALSRQWELLKLLPNKGRGKTVREFVELLNERGFNVGKRQVERDLLSLLESFPIECNDDSKPYLWCWVADASVDLVGLTQAEAFSLKLVEESTRSLLPPAVLRAVEPHFQQATRKLNSLEESSSVANWVKKVRVVSPAMPMLAPRIKPEVLETVQDSLLMDRQLDVEYCSFADQTPKQLRLQPLALVQRGSVIYLIAALASCAAPRLYALHRISEACGVEEKAVYPEDFSLDEYIESGALNFGKGDKLLLDARVEDGLARHLEETPLSRDQKMNKRDGYYHLQATVSDSWQLRWWILSQGDGIRVDGPAPLRNEIISSLESAMASYAE